MFLVGAEFNHAVQRLRMQVISKRFWSINHWADKAFPQSSMSTQILIDKLKPPKSANHFLFIVAEYAVDYIALTILKARTVGKLIIEKVVQVVIAKESNIFGLS